MKRIILAALTVLSLAACSGPTINGPSDMARCFPANRCGDINGSV